MSHTSADIIARNFRVLQKIGEGAMGSVYKVRNEVDGKILALKKLKARVSASSLARAFFAIHQDQTRPATTSSEAAAGDTAVLTREFVYMSALRHPNLIEVYDLVADTDGRFYLVMEFLEGRNLHDYQRAEAPVSPVAVADIFTQLFRGLAFLHAKGFIHRDLKPENVFISSEQRVKILDYGLMTTQNSSSNNAAGTPDYSAPEALLHGAHSPRADLYSCGLMLNELLLGRKEHGQGPMGAGVAFGEKPGDKTLHGPFRNIVRKLLEPEPLQRYACAEDALNDLMRAASTGQTQETSSTIRSFILGARLLQRDKEMTVLARRYAELQAGEGGLLFIAGESGIGKSRLCREFGTHVKTSGGLFLQGSYYEDAGDTFSALREVIPHTLALAGAGLRERFKTELDSVLPPDVAGRNQSPRPQQQKVANLQHTYRALLSYFCTLAQQLKRPLVLLLEDIHFLDDYRFFSVAHSALKQSGVLVLGNYRDDEVPADFLREFGVSTMTLKQFPPQFFRSMAGEIFNTATPDEHFLDKLESYTSGNPFFIEQLLLELAGRNALKRQGDHWVIQDIDFQTLEIPGVDEILARRYTGLDRAERTVMQFVSACSRSLPKALLEKLLPGIRLSAVLDKLAQKHILQEDSTNLRAAHHRVKQFFYADIRNRHDLHLQLARVYELHEHDNIYEAAFHYERSSDRTKALHFLELAADTARRNRNFSLALSYFKKLLLRLDESPDESGLAIDTHLKASDTFKHIGDVAAAKNELGHAKTLATQTGDEYRLHASTLRLADLYVGIRQNVDNEQALKRAGAYFTANGFMKELARTYRLRAFAALQRGKGEAALHWLYRQRKLGIRIGDKQEIGSALCNIGLIHNTRGDLRKAVRFLNEALETVKDSDDTLLMAAIYSNLGNSFLHLGNIDTAMSCFQKEIGNYRQLGYRPEIAKGLNGLASIHTHKGENDKALELYREAFSLCADAGHVHEQTELHGNIGYVYLDRCDYTRALWHYRMNLKLSAGMKYRKPFIQAMTKLGNVYKNTGHFRKAFLYLHKAYADSRRLGYANNIVVSGCYLAELYWRGWRDSRAQQIVDDIEAQCRKSGANLLLAHLLQVKAQFYHKRRCWRKAFHCIRESRSLAAKAGSSVQNFDSRLLFPRMTFSAAASHRKADPAWMDFCAQQLNPLFALVWLERKTADIYYELWLFSRQAPRYTPWGLRAAYYSLRFRKEYKRLAEECASVQYRARYRELRKYETRYSVLNGQLCFRRSRNASLRRMETLTVAPSFITTYPPLPFRYLWTSFRFIR